MRLPSREARRKWIRHWISDPLAGARLFAAHEALRALPTPAASHFGARLAPLVGPRVHPAVDGRIRAGLRALRPDLAPDEAALDAAAKRAWSSVGRSYAEFSIEDRVWPEGRVTVEGAEHAMLGRPRIVVGVHTGNWELIPYTLGWLGHSVVDIYQPPRNRFEARIANRARRRCAERVRRTRPDLQLQLIAPSATAGLELSRAMRDGFTLMIYGDESVGGRALSPAFGRPLRTDGNFARVSRLARLTGAEVTPAYVVRDPDDARYTVRFLPPVPMQATRDRDADLLANVAALDAAVTPIVLEHIDQWYQLVDLQLDR